MTPAMRRLVQRPAWGAPADDWSRSTGARMVREGYAHGAIIDKLTAYGCGLYAAQRIVREAAEEKDGKA